jgi:type II secretion system protein C
MIKGLAIRRMFNAAEVILGIILFVIIGYAIHAFTKPPAELSSSPSIDAETVAFNTVGDLDEYKTILDSGLFGPSAKLATKGPVNPPITLPPPSDTEVETSLPLTLKGLVVSDPPWASATIEVREKGQETNTYYIDQEIIDGVILKEIRRKEVVMENKRSNRREVLRLEFVTADAKGRSNRFQPTIQRSRPKVSSAQVAKRTQTVTLNKKEITDQLNKDYEKFASTVDVKVIEEDGKVKGITTDNIEDIPSAKRLGFKNGDILVSVNNENVDSVDKISSIANKYKDSPTLRIEILRDNKPMTFNYRLR